MVWQQENRIIYEDFLERHRFVLILFISSFLFLSVRLFYLQVIKGSYYHKLSEEQRTHIILERAPRGIIYDEQGSELAKNRTAFVALFYPFSQDKTPTKEILDKLKTIIITKDLAARITEGWRTGKSVTLSANLTRLEMFRLQEQRLVIPGLSVVKEERREYVDPLANSHLAGYLNEVTAQELENLSKDGYKPSDWIGRRGLEQTFNSVLRGQDGGWQIEVDASGRQTRIVRHITAKPGNNLYTTINAKLQKVAYQAIAETKSGKGAVVAIDPRTGAVKIFVSVPGFDPNISFLPDFGAYLKDKSLPLFDRALQALYAPGSIFKIITFVAGVNEGRIDQSQTIFCKGYFELGDKIFKCWEKKGHGNVNLIQAMAKSCDVYFYQLGLKIGPKLMAKYARDFQLGKVTNIEIPSEKAGLIPDPEWKVKKMHEGWRQGDTVNMSVGQGFLWITPLQAAAMMSGVAARGIIYQPYIVDRIETPQGELIYQNSKRAISEVKLTDETWELLHYALKEVVKNGTGGGCYIPDLSVSGKTGTAQNPQGDDHSWFVGYAPSDKPELAVAVLIENGGSGGGVAAPIARKIFDEAFKERGLMSKLQ
jgi:penicillin-binding protein 2